MSGSGSYRRRADRASYAENKSSSVFLLLSTEMPPTGKGKDVLSSVGSSRKVQGGTWTAGFGWRSGSPIIIFVVCVVPNRHGLGGL